MKLKNSLITENKGVLGLGIGISPFLMSAMAPASIAMPIFGGALVLAIITGFVVEFLF